MAVFAGFSGISLLIKPFNKCRITYSESDVLKCIFQNNDIIFPITTFILTLFTTTVHSTDINECTVGGNNCDRNATCTDIDGSFDCSCNTGYSGDGTYCQGLYYETTYIACK